MMKVLHEEITRIHQIMNLHEGKHGEDTKRQFVKIYSDGGGSDDAAEYEGKVISIPVKNTIPNEPFKGLSYMENSKIIKLMIKSINSGNKLPPIKVIEHPHDSSKYLVVDGNHRRYAFSKSDKENIDVVVIPHKDILLMKNKWGEEPEKYIKLSDFLDNQGEINKYFVKPDNTNDFESPEIKELHEGKHGNLPYLKRRLSVDVASELFSDAISKASDMLRKKKDKIGGVYDLKKFTNTVVGVMYDSFFNDFIVRGEKISDDLSSDEVWDYIVQVFGDRIADRYYEMMNLHEGKHGNLPYLKRRLSVDVESELFSNAISTASNLLRKAKQKWGGYDLEKFTNMVVSIMYDSFFDDFAVRGEEIPDELSYSPWNYLLQVFGDRIAERYYEIMNEPENQEEKNKIREMMGLDKPSRQRFDFQQLVDNGVIWITQPHVNGQRVEPNWEGDSNLITLWNIKHPDEGQEWVYDAIKHPKPEAIEWWTQEGQDTLSDAKYNQILRSIKMVNSSIRN